MTAQASRQISANDLVDVSAAVALPSVFKALGDPLRVQVLRLLRGDSLSVSELCEVFQLRQSALSHHLKVLVQANLVVRRREGTAVFYRRQLPSGEHSGLIDAVFQAIDAELLGEDISAGLARVQSQRERNSVDFFLDNSDRFQEQRELIASWQDYSQGTLHLLERCGELSQKHILEIGPGDGSLLPELAKRAHKVTALDNSEVMLQTAQAHCDLSQDIDFRLGTPADLNSEPTRFDIAVANMVLHHTPNPEQVMRDIAGLLTLGGALVVSELCAHDQAWAREHCGDLWLGFEPDQLTEWAREAQLTPTAEVFITQRNGFQIQVRLFKRLL